MYDDNEIEELAPWFLIIVTLIGGALRIFLLSNKGLELEETFSMWLANHSIGEMLQWIARIDHHPPLYYVLLHFWIKFNGVKPNDLRMLSALFGAGTIPIIYLIGKRMSGVMMGLAASVILALSPFNIRLAQVARMYTLLMFNVAVAIYALVRLLTDARSTLPIGRQFRDYIRAWGNGGPIDADAEKSFSYEDLTSNQVGWRGWIARHRWLPIESIETDLAWLAFIVFSAATLLSHNSGILFFLAINIFVLGLMFFQRVRKSQIPPTFKAPSLSNWLKAQIGILLLYSPWIFSFIKQTSGVFQDFLITKLSWVGVIQTIESFLNEYTLPPSSQMVMMSLYALMLGVGLVHFRKKLSQLSFLAILFVVPFLSELLIRIRLPIDFKRTLIWTTIPLFLILAAGIVQLRFRFLMVVVLAVLGMNNLFSASDYFRFYQKENWNYPAGFVAKWIKNDDLMLFNAPWAEIPFNYYFKPYEDKYLIQVEKRGVPSDLFDSGELEPKVTESDIPRLTSLLNGHKRVWVIYSQNSNTDPMGIITQTLESEMKLIVKRDFNGVQVQWFETP